MADLDRKALEHLAKLARISLDPAEEAGLVDDLRKILAHFEELSGLNTENVQAMTGGTDLRNEFRDSSSIGTNLGNGKDGFPATQKGYLKVPPVFE